MKKDLLSVLPLWDQFQKAARQRRRNPERLLSDYMRERLEIWADRQLDEEIQRDARRSGYREEDAVDLVRQYRRGKRERRAVS
ncbi:MAG: hypothetical protein FJ147_08565 [Deltaproteobacteria bacterium]|nr:hypothetical protein [Deltaproteobacteria bacterium]